MANKKENFISTKNWSKFFFCSFFGTDSPRAQINSSVKNFEQRNRYNTEKREWTKAKDSKT